MYCSKCGKLIPDDSVFCSGCGAKTGVGGSGVESSSSPTTKEGWMLLALREAISPMLKNPDSAKFSDFQEVSTDSYGRTYAEVVVHATNSYNAVVPSRYSVCFYDVTDNAPCKVAPRGIQLMTGLMLSYQRSVAKTLYRFGKPRK